MTDNKELPDGFTVHDIQALHADPLIKKLADGPSLHDSAVNEIRHLAGLSKEAQHHLIEYMGDGWAKMPRTPRDAEDGKGLAQDFMGDVVLNARREIPDGFTAQDIKIMQSYPPVQKYIAEVDQLSRHRAGNPKP